MTRVHWHLMRSSTLATAAWLLLARDHGVVHAIENGTSVTDPQMYPFYVMIGNPHLCGGLILSFDPAYIMTAAHCVMGSTHPKALAAAGEANPYFVGYGHIDRRQQHNVAIVDWRIHPQYEATQTPEFDVAVLTLEHPLRRSATTEKAVFWTQPLPENEANGTLIGFGYDNAEGSEPRIMQKLSLEVFPFVPMVATIATSVRQRPHDRIACHGDSGSPLLVHLPYEMPASTLMQAKTSSPTLQPYVLGGLTRIFGVYDADPMHPTCSTPLGASASIVHAFTNMSLLLPWVADASHQSVDQLTHPGTDHSWRIPPHPNALMPNLPWHLGRWFGIPVLPPPKFFKLRNTTYHAQQHRHAMITGASPNAAAQHDLSMSMISSWVMTEIESL
ncbi:trypsin-like cysteine/serine peptidase domain-containing protein [Gongronella butleri]|nr:trypsin-like cysteine/serine peptidase domain-containing protein [Gongronella butleri]